MLVFCSPQIGWRWYQLVPNCFQKFLLVGINQRMSEQRHKVICHYNETPVCLCCPEVMCDKIINGEIILQFLLFCFSESAPSAIWVIYNLDRQVKVGYEAAVSVFPEIFPILEKIQLLDLFSRSFLGASQFLAWSSQRIWVSTNSLPDRWFRIFPIRLSALSICVHG